MKTTADDAKRTATKEASPPSADYPHASEVAHNEERRLPVKCVNCDWRFDAGNGPGRVLPGLQTHSWRARKSGVPRQAAMIAGTQAVGVPISERGWPGHSAFTSEKPLADAEVGASIQYAVRHLNADNL